MDIAETQIGLPARIAVLLTCFNRRELTLQALGALFQQERRTYDDLDVFLVDDGSTDGTADAVAERFPRVHILRGDGSLFWNGGMRKAFAAAMAQGFDFYLWLNDDTKLVPDAIERLLVVARDYLRQGKPAIVAGSTIHPETGKRSYGGQLKEAQGLRLRFRPLPIRDDAPIQCSTMNGNFVLVPRVIAVALGNLDSVFRHQIGDLDYGLRATSAGFQVVMAPGFHGYCVDNSTEGTWRDAAAPLRQRWKNLLSPKGAPPREWIHYVRRHFGWRWPLYALSPYVNAIFGKRRTNAQGKNS